MPSDTNGDDPQVIVEGELQRQGGSDAVVFKLRMLSVEWVVSAIIPDDSHRRAPVYVKRGDLLIASLEGILKSTSRSDIIVVHLPLAPLRFELVALVTIPHEGATTAPVYLKHRIR